MKKGLETGFVLWLTGLPGSGKTTISLGLRDQIENTFGLKAQVLDGDDLRNNLSPDLGFSKEDREFHARRVTYIANLLARNGIIVIVALISPYMSSRREARENITNFVEVYVKCSAAVCAKRDPKGLYTKARMKKLQNLTGVQDPYEIPLRPEVEVDTESLGLSECIECILKALTEMKYLA